MIKSTPIAAFVALLTFLIAGIALADPGAPQSPQASVLVLDGLVKQPLQLAGADLLALPVVRHEITFTGPRGEERASYEGVLLWTLLDRAKLDDSGKRADLRHTMTISGRDGYRIVLAIGEIDPDFGNKPAMIALRRNGEPLPPDEGLRLVVPGDKHGGRNVHNVIRITVD